MKKLGIDFLLNVVIVLDFIITVLSLVLGCLMYTSNAKSIIQNTIYVETTDLIANIRYGLHFGKSLETYYGMEDELNSALLRIDDVENMYIVSDESGLLFRTDDSELSKDVIGLGAGSNILKGNVFYCAYRLTDDSRLITVGEISNRFTEWKEYYRHLVIVAFLGFLVSSAVMIIVWKMIKNKDRGYKLLIALLILWIIIISGYVGYSAYTEYGLSIAGMEQSIVETIEDDMRSVHDLGIKDENISGVDEYLLRYTDSIPEIDSIEFDGENYRLQTSSTYMRKVAVDYLLQALLLLAFSSMILAEYQIFMSGVGMKELGEDVNE